MRGEFYKMDFRAWNTGTVDLTLEQEAAYLRLCHAMYDAQGPVPDSSRLLQGIFRCGNVKAAALVRQLIDAGKIQRTDDQKLTNRRVQSELAHREELLEKRRSAGAEGGRSRRDPTDRNPSGGRVTAECSPSDPRVTSDRSTSEQPVAGSNSLEDIETTEANASTSLNERRGEERREEIPPKAPTAPASEEPALFEDLGNVTVLPRQKRTGPSLPEIAVAFEAFWSAYPRREGGNPKKPALDKFVRAVRQGADPEAIVEGAKAYGEMIRRTGKADTSFVSQSVKWLNQQGWLDDYEPTAPPNTKWHMV